MCHLARGRDACTQARRALRPARQGDVRLPQPDARGACRGARRRRPHLGRALRGRAERRRRRARAVNLGPVTRCFYMPAQWMASYPQWAADERGKTVPNLPPGFGLPIRDARVLPRGAFAALQLVGMFYVSLATALPFSAVIYTFVAIEDNLERWQSVLLLPALFAGGCAANAALVVLSKWALVGRFHEGKYAMWSMTFLKWWLMRKLLAIPRAYGDATGRRVSTGQLRIVTGNSTSLLTRRASSRGTRGSWRRRRSTACSCAASARRSARASISTAHSSSRWI